MVTSYLDEVRPNLWGHMLTRRRVEAELADHLMEAVAQLESEGLSRSEAERVAMDRFGSPAEVARAFARSKGVGMATQFTKWSGLAMLVGLPILIAARMYAASSWEFSIGWYAEIASAAGALVLAGLVGMYLRLRGQLGKPGRIGFRAMLAGFVIGMVSSSLWFVVGAQIGLAILLTGAATYVYAMFKTSVFPRSAYALIATGAAGAAVIGFAGVFASVETEWVAAPWGHLFGGAGLMLIGAHLWREVPEEVGGLPPAATV